MMAKVTQIPMDQEATAKARAMQNEMLTKGRDHEARPTYGNSRFPEDQGRKQLAQELRRRLG